MPSESHPAVLAVLQGAQAVVAHVRDAHTGSFWRRWFEKPDERHFADEVRAFIAALDRLLDVPPQMISREDLAGIGENTERVVGRIEMSIEDGNVPGGDAGASLAAAVYVIRARYEALYIRGASI
jgi:hypothetical protein